MLRHPGRGWAAAFLLTGAWPSAAPARAEGELTVTRSFGKVRGWSIASSDAQGGCLAAATYGDDTTVWLGLKGEGRTAFLAFTNPRWKSLEAGRSYTVAMRAQRRGNWKGSFTGIENGLYASGLKDGFLRDLGGAGGLLVAYQDKQIAALSLAGAAEALEAVGDCLRDYVTAGARPGAGAPPGARESKTSQGTGFFVSERGHVLTNHHVIDGCRQVEVARPGGTVIRAQVVASDSTNDVAVLKTDLRPDTVPALAPRARIGEPVYVYGYPLSGILATTGNFTIGNVTATAGLADDSRMLQISAPVQPGNSGGPLVDGAGNVVGVIVSKLNVLKMAALTNDFAQNVNFAIKSSVAVNFLEANGVSTSADVNRQPINDPATIAELSKSFVVKINCR